MKFSPYGNFVVCLEKVLIRLEPLCTHRPNQLHTEQCLDSKPTLLHLFHVSLKYYNMLHTEEIKIQIWVSTTPINRKQSLENLSI